MDRTFICSLCPQMATHCCMCSPVRFYCCSACLPSHTSKGGFHPLAPATLPPSITAQTLPAYTAKVTAIKQFSYILEGWRAQLDLERCSLGATINTLYTEQVATLYAMWTTANTEITNFYDRVRCDLDSISKELQSLEDDSQKSLSDITRRLMAAGVHPRQSHCYLDVAALTRNTIRVFAEAWDLPREDCLLTILQYWDEAKCECQDCTNARDCILGAEDCYRERPRSLPMDGERCKDEEKPEFITHRMYQSFVDCDPYLKADALPAEIMPRAVSVPVLPTWTCERCRFPSNPEDAKNCQQCKKNKDLWMCWECGRNNPNDNEMCEACGMHRAWKDFLVRKKVELSVDQTQWRCKRCGEYSGLDVDRCASCGRREEIIQKGRLGQGRRAGFLGVLRRVFT